MAHKDSTIKWAISMNTKVEKEAQKILQSYNRIHRIFGIRETHMKTIREYKFIYLRLEKITNWVHVNCWYGYGICWDGLV